MGNERQPPFTGNFDVSAEGSFIKVKFDNYKLTDDNDNYYQIIGQLSTENARRLAAQLIIISNAVEQKYPIETFSMIMHRELNELQEMNDVFVSKIKENNRKLMREIQLLRRQIDGG